MIIVLFCILNFSQISGQTVTEIDREGISYFEELYRKYNSSTVSVILVSLDFPNQVEKQLLPFIQEKEISAPVLLMTDLNYNGWVDQVDPTWSGALPATLIYNRESRIFLEKELTRDELFKHVNQILN